MECPARTVSWTQGTNTCSGTISSTKRPNATGTVTDTTIPNRGAARYTCNGSTGSFSLTNRVCCGSGTVYHSGSCHIPRWDIGACVCNGSETCSVSSGFGTYTCNSASKRLTCSPTGKDSDCSHLTKPDTSCTIAGTRPCCGGNVNAGGYNDPFVCHSTTKSSCELPSLWCCSGGTSDCRFWDRSNDRWGGTQSYYLHYGSCTTTSTRGCGYQCSFNGKGWVGGEYNGCGIPPNDNTTPHPCWGCTKGCLSHSICTDCSSDSDCGTGKQCSIGRCYDLKNCSSQADCSSGYSCRNGYCYPTNY